MRLWLALFATAGLALTACTTETDADDSADDQITEEADPCDDPAALRDEAIENGTALLDGITLESSTPIGDILADLTGFDGQTVQIEGTVVDLCTSAGCWSSLDDGTGQLNLKVTDGVVDFRDHAEIGSYAIGEGVFDEAGEHGSQVFLDGAVIGTIVCP